MTFRLTILLAILAAIGLQPLKADPKPSVEEIFGSRYLNHMDSMAGKSIQKALHKDLSHSRAYFSPKDIERLSVDDKCMLALYWGLSLPLDGEYAETFGNFLGKDRIAVAHRLQKISDEDLQEFCKGMQYPQYRATYLKRQIKDWLDPKMSGWFQDTNDH